jgi:hypothetical protein
MEDAECRGTTMSGSEGHTRSLYTVVHWCTLVYAGVLSWTGYIAKTELMHGLEIVQRVCFLFRTYRVI